MECGAHGVLTLRARNHVGSEPKQDLGNATIQRRLEVEVHVQEIRRIHLIATYNHVQVNQIIMSSI